jgi:hypothetical protein
VIGQHNFSVGKNFEVENVQLLKAISNREKFPRTENVQLLTMIFSENFLSVESQIVVQVTETQTTAAYCITLAILGFYMTSQK